MNRHDEARRWIEQDREFVWHPFTPMRQWIAGGEEPGRMIVAGEGFELIDHLGRRFIDGFGSLWCNLHGHRVPEIDDAIHRQLDRIAHSTLLGHACPPSVELAERLVRITPAGLGKVFYSDSGASAVEIALKMAYQFYRNQARPRRKFLALRESYHGDTIGAVSVGGIDTFHRMFRPLLFETTFVDSPNPYHHPAGEQAGSVVLEQIDQALATGKDEYCAVVVEPLIQGAAGMWTHPRGFLAGVRALASRHDVLLIADEVATGFGATGKRFACQHEDVCPDLMCLGKRLTGGYLPLAATMATREIFDAFCGEIEEGKTFYHGHTFTGNALACAAAVASLDLIESTDLIAHLPAKAELIASRLTALADHPNVGDVRQCGMMAGIELVENRGQRTPFDPARRIAADVCLAARNRGVILRPLGDVIVLMPAPAMDTETLERLLTATVETIHDYFAGSVRV